MGIFRSPSGRSLYQLPPPEKKSVFQLHSIWFLPPSSAKHRLVEISGSGRIKHKRARTNFTSTHDTFTLTARLFTYNARVLQRNRKEIEASRPRPPALQPSSKAGMSFDILEQFSHSYSLIISLFTSLWGLDGPRKEWMLPTTKDADLPQRSNVHERETNVAENGVSRKKQRLSNNVKNGTCETSTDPLQRAEFHPHKKQKTVFPVEGVEKADSSMAEPQRKANSQISLLMEITFTSRRHWRTILPNQVRLRSSW